MRSIAPAVEDRGIDEIYIDLTEVVADQAPASPFDRTAIARVARAIKGAVRDATNLSCSIGIAPNKLLAKIASDLEKPDGARDPRRGGRADAHLAACAEEDQRHRPEGQRTADRDGYRHDRCARPRRRSARCDRFGPNTARWMHEVAHGRDRRVIATRSDARSMSRETTFERDLHAVRDRAALGEIFTMLCEKLASDLARKGYVARNIGLKLRYDDFSIATRATTLTTPTQDAQVIRRVAGECARRAPLERRIRLLGVRAGTLMRVEQAVALSAEADQRRTRDLFDDSR